MITLATEKVPWKTRLRVPLLPAGSLYLRLYKKKALASLTFEEVEHLHT
jgi:hypothetical protein